MVYGFETGDRPTLDEVLNTRENRAGFQHLLLHKFPDHPVISFKLNIPGPVKNNEAIRQIFRIGQEDILAQLNAHRLDICYQKTLDLPTGPELFLVVEAQPWALKKAMTILEEETPLGRLYDIDVLHEEEGEQKSVSRTQLGLPSRRCLVCEKDAKVCGRSRAHTMDEMHDVIRKMMNNERRLKI